MPKIYSLGELNENHIDEMNIPMNIFLTSHTFETFYKNHPNFCLEDLEESDPSLSFDDTVYVISAGNYTPRREHMSPDAYEFMSSDKQELINMVNTRIVPLYEIAVSNLKLYGYNYYWEPNKKD